MEGWLQERGWLRYKRKRWLLLERRNMVPVVDQALIDLGATSNKKKARRKPNKDKKASEGYSLLDVKVLLPNTSSPAVHAARSHHQPSLPPARAEREE